MDDNIEYLGRNDFQIRINGYRMELGEIKIQIAPFPPGLSRLLF